MAILITGGLEYIGSHTLVELAKENYDFIVYDNLSNSSRKSIKRVEKIIGKNITLNGNPVATLIFENLPIGALKALEQMCIDSWRWQSNNPNGYNNG